MGNKLEEQIKVVAKAREEVERLNTEKQDAFSQWETEHKSLLFILKDAGEYKQEQEVLLRELTLQAYAETGNKTPAVGVGIREVTIYDYDSAEALAWAVEHNLALKLDESAFKKIVKATPLPFVTSTTEPQATIAQDLATS